MKKAAYILSVVFHPLFMPLWCFLFLAKLDPVLSLYFAGSSFWPILFILVLNTIVGPLLSIIVLKKQGIVDSLELPTIKGRSMVYLLSLVYFVLTYILFQRFGMPALVSRLMIGLIAVVAILMLVSLRYKASAHMAAVGGFLAIILWTIKFYGVFDPVSILTAILLTGAIGTARLVLKAHTLGELGWGLLIGMAGVFIPLAMNF